MEDLKFYGRRKGKKLNAGKQETYATTLPRVDVTSHAQDPCDPRDFFHNDTKKIWLEIGFGDGAHLADQAARHPDVGMIGCEPFLNGIAALCVHIATRHLENIRIFPDDARKLLSALAPRSIDGCFLLNSDPWPKKRHHKRRFLQQETLSALHRSMKTGAFLCISTDHADLAAWSLDQTLRHGGFAWTAETSADWQRPAQMIETRYQKKGVIAGRPTVFLNFVAIDAV
jgi:tRNA (guanine-N7-)-methyltransferase